jgi:hypothetical protein
MGSGPGRRRLALAAVLSALLAGSPARADFIPLGDLPGGIIFFSEAIGVSADGSVVVGSSISASGIEAFRCGPR